MATDDNDNDDEKYTQREAFIRNQLNEKGLIPKLEEMARVRGFTENPANAVAYVISEFARDEKAYQDAVSGSYEPEQYSLLADIRMSKLQQQAAAHRARHKNDPIQRQ